MIQQHPWSPPPTSPGLAFTTSMLACYAVLSIVSVEVFGVPEAGAAGLCWFGVSCRVAWHLNSKLGLHESKWVSRHQVSLVLLRSFPVREDLSAGQQVKEGRFIGDAYSLIPPFQEFAMYSSWTRSSIMWGGWMQCLALWQLSQQRGQSVAMKVIG